VYTHLFSPLYIKSNLSFYAQSFFVLNIYFKNYFILDSQVLVAHACNPSYSGGRDQEDHGSKSAWVNSSWDPISKNLHKNKAGRVAQREGLIFELAWVNNTVEYFCANSIHVCGVLWRSSLTLLCSHSHLGNSWGFNSNFLFNNRDSMSHF
jgi:hypothetical protein